MPRHARTAIALAVVAMLMTGVAAVLARPPRPAPAPSASPPITQSAAAEPTTVSVSTVAPLRHLSQPDLFITTKGRLSAKEVRQLRRATKARHLTVVSVGTIRVAGKKVRALGVNPSDFRGFTPPPTAASDQLWENVVAGDLAASYHLARRKAVSVGNTVPVRGAGAQSVRVGAAAVFDLPRVGVVVRRGLSEQLGLHHRAGVVLSAPGLSGADLAALARGVLGDEARIVALDQASRASSGGKPRTFVELYQAAARTCPGLSWSILAAIGQIESGHGVNVGPSSKGALGPMQFMPKSWKRWATDGDGDRTADIMNPYDAVHAASRYLCSYAPGASKANLRRAIFGYNHAHWYVRDVLSLAKLYRR